MKVTLTQKEKDFVRKAGEYRTKENMGGHDIASYKFKKYDDLFGNCIGLMAEAAVVKAFGYDVLCTPLDVWPSFYLKEHKSIYDGADRSDLNTKYGNFEVRNVTELSKGLAVRKKDKTANAKVIKTHIPVIQYWDQEVGEMRYRTAGNEVELAYWVDANEAWDSPEAFTPWYCTNGDTKELASGNSIEELFTTV